MLRCCLIAFALIVTASPARGEVPPKPDKDLTEAPFSIGVNSPTGWFMDDPSYGASFSIGLGKHHAVRANYASYAARNSPVAGVLAGLLHAEREGSISGPIEDIGLGYVYYPRALWSGPMYELGVLRRERETSQYVPTFSKVTDTTTTDYAARALVGWSWRLPHFLYVAAAVGIAVGRERGSEESAVPGIPETMQTSKVDRASIAPEAYLRFGFAFGR
jgi:hypothetical protein